MTPLIRKFQQIAEKAQLSNGTKKAKLAFAKLVREENNIRNLDRVTKGLKTVGRLKPGMLVAYEYDPKYKVELPFYDRFPLVFILQVNKDGWVGINLHYLHPNVRAYLFYQMEKNKVKFSENEMTKALDSFSRLDKLIILLAALVNLGAKITKKLTFIVM